MTARLGAVVAVVLAASTFVPGVAAASLDQPVERASGLNLPWEVLALPDGKKLVTERSSPPRVRVLGFDNVLRNQPAYSDNTASKFLGMALSPGFASNGFVFLYLTRWSSGAGRQNTHASKVIRLFWDGTNLTNPSTVFDGGPGADDGIWSDGNHDGGRIAFGPDAKLYVTTGDVHDKDVPQNLDRLNGKILRLNEDGSAPSDNPFPGPGMRQFVWSYGHRHPQGIAWDSTGRMWETEHGPSQGAGPYTSTNEDTKRSRDEINRIEPGCNYGWPVATAEQTAPGISPPAAYSGTTPSTTWAPGGLSIGADGRLYVPLLAGQRLLSYPIDGDTVGNAQTLYSSTYGRLRTAETIGTSLWLATSNSGATGVDKLLEVPFSQLATPVLPTPVRRGACPASPDTPQSVVGSVAPVTGVPVTGAVPAAPTPAAPITRKAVVTALTRLLVGESRTIARRRARALAGATRLRLQAPALPAKRLSLALALVDGRRRVPFAAGSASTGTARSTTVTLRSRRAARRTLARLAGKRPRVTLVLTARLRTADGRLISSSRRFKTRRAG